MHFFKKVRPLVFYPSFVGLLILSLYSLYIGVTGNIEAEKAYVAAMRTISENVMDNFGWFYALLALTLVLFVVWLALSPYGRIRFGGDTAKPRFKYWNWFAMTLCGGIGTGIVFWAVAEPMMQFSAPPSNFGLTPFSPAAATFSLSQIFIEWTFTPYAIYTVCGIASGYAFFNLNKPRSISSTLEPALGSFAKGPGGHIVDAVILFSLAGGLITSLSSGIMQLTSGFEFMFGEVNQRTLYAIIMLVTVLLYTGSSYTGIDKGIKVLSSCNAFIFIMIMLFVFIVGPSSFIMDIFVQSIGEYADNFFSRHLYLGVVSNDPYPRWWTIYFFTVWFAWAPITGMFLARLSYGRTIREFILVNMVVPSVFGMLWFSIFGGTAIHMEAVQHLGLADAIHSLGNEGASFAFFNYLPLSRFLVVIFFLTALLSFVTAADSMTSTIAIISSKDSADGSGEAPVSLKIIWGLVMGAIAWAVITFAKIDGFKMTSMIFGIPAAVVVMLQGYCVVKMLRENESPESCKKITQTKD